MYVCTYENYLTNYVCDDCFLLWGFEGFSYLPPQLTRSHLFIHLHQLSLVETKRKNNSEKKRERKFQCTFYWHQVTLRNKPLYMQ